MWGSKLPVVDAVRGRKEFPQDMVREATAAGALWSGRKRLARILAHKEISAHMSEYVKFQVKKHRDNMIVMGR